MSTNPSSSARIQLSAQSQVEHGDETVTLDSIIGTLAVVRDALVLGSHRVKTDLELVNQVIQQLSVLGLWQSQILLGPIVLRRAHGIGGPEGSGELLQVAVSSEIGIAMIFWDSEDLHAADLSGSVRQLAFDNAISLVECKPAIQALAWQHVPRLLTKLLVQTRIE